jgi:hypothetical protein
MMKSSRALRHDTETPKKDMSEEHERWKSERRRCGEEDGKKRHVYTRNPKE